MIVAQGLRGLFSAFYARPFNEDLCARVGHLGSEGKCVDARYTAVDGIIADIPEATALGQRARERAEDELDLVHPRVVGAHIAVRGVQGAVHDDYLGMGYGGLQARLQHTRGDGEHGLAAVRDRFFYLAFDVIDAVGYVRRGADAVAEDGLDMQTSALVILYPAGLRRLGVVYEGHLHDVVRGHDGLDLREQALLLLLWRVGLELDGVGLVGQLDLLPHLGQLGLYRIRVDGREVMIAVYLDITEHGVADGDAQLLSSGGDVGLFKEIVHGRKFLLLILRPLFVGSLPHRLQKGLVAALFLELDEVDPACFVEFEVFVVALNVLVVGLFGQDAGNVGLHAVGLEEFEHADALVALFDIIAVHVLVYLDGLADALAQVGATELLPLIGELGGLFEYGHEVGREGVDPAAGLGADDEPHGYLDEAELLCGHRFFGGDKVVQHGQAGRPAGR